MQRKKKENWIGISIIVLLAVLMIVLYKRVGEPMTELVRNTDQLREWVDRLGWKSRLVYMGMVCFQVLVAFVPGEPLELAAGFVFGALEGTLLCLAGIALGSAIVFGLVRAFGVRLVRLFFSQEKIDSLRILKNPKRLFLITVALMILPGTPKDLLTYCAGLTPISFGAWMLVSSVGRIPSVLTSTLGGHFIQNENYAAAIVIFAITAVLCGAGLWLFAWMKQRRAEKHSET